MLYKKDEKSAEYIIFNCSFARSTWNACARALELKIALDTNIWRRLDRGGNDRHELRMVIATYCWNISRERNNKLFNDKYHFVHYCLKLSNHNFIIWTDILSDEESFHLSDNSLGDDIDGTPPGEKYGNILVVRGKMEW